MLLVYLRISMEWQGNRRAAVFLVVQLPPLKHGDRCAAPAPSAFHIVPRPGHPAHPAQPCPPAAGPPRPPPLSVRQAHIDMVLDSCEELRRKFQLLVHSEALVRGSTMRAACRAAGVEIK